MKKQLNQVAKIQGFRQFLLARISGLTTAQLNEIPPGYNNNIIWNITHLTSALQSLCYVRAGLPIAIDERYFTPFLPGTKPERVMDEPEIELVKTMFITSVDKLQADMEQQLFQTYSPSERIAAIYGVEVNTIEDALDFVLYHEGFHTGYVLALKHRL
ncbi:MAG: DinB family protein [Janthinobacterium lividum]